jgi:hypothetical protein
LIQEEIKRRLDSDACYHSVHNLLYSRPLSKILKITVHKTIISPVVLYWCEIWSLTIRDEIREKKVLRRIFGSDRDEVTGGWRKAHNEELHNWYCSTSRNRTINSRRMRWAGHVARMRENRDACRILVGKPEGKTTRKTKT